MTTPSPARKSYLSTLQFARLSHACWIVKHAFGDPPYLVGSSTERADFRDVDIRTILADDHYDELFKDREFFWSIVCLGISSYLSDVSGLPVDYQIQRMTEANEKHDKPRCAMGLGAVLFAGGGDG